MNKFLDDNKKRLLATLLLSGLFIWFWQNGPLQEHEPVVSPGTGDHEFFKPKIISLDKKSETSKFGMVTNNDEHENYYGLTGQKNNPAYWRLVADPNNNPAMDKLVGKTMLQHGKKLENNSKNFKLKKALEMYYVEFQTSMDSKSLYLENAGDLTRNIKGYAGPIVLGMVINTSGEIKALHHVSSRETTSYLERIQDSGFYKQFASLPLSKETQKIDAVSGATLTTVAIARSATSLVEIASDSPLGIYLDDDTHEFRVDAVLSKTWILHAFIIFLFFIFAWQRWIRRSRKRILMMAIFSIVYIGFYLNNSFTYVTFLHPFLGVSLSGLAAIYAALVLWSAIWNQNGYCRYVCPYGNFQRLLTRFVPQLRQQLFFPTKHLKKARLILTIILASGIVLGLRHWSSFELYPDLFGFNLSSAWLWISLALAAISLIYPMLWCRLLCPSGAVLDLLTKWTNPKRASKPTEVIESVISFVPKKPI